MTHSQIPHFDRPISRLILGSMGLSLKNLDQTFEIMDEFVRLGGNAVDTAHCYGPDKQGAVGEYLRQRGRDTLILLDKGCHPYQGRKRVTREDMESDIRESQERMGIDRTDVFVLHRDDPDVPAGNVIEWLNEQKTAGRIEAFGASNWTHRRIEEANRYAETPNLQGFSLSSPNLALAVPKEAMWEGAMWLDRPARTWYEETQLPVFSWSSGSAGFFAGNDSPDIQRVYFNDENLAKKARAEELANKYDLTPTQIAVAWALNQPSNVFAIVGPRTVQEVRDNLAVADLKLSTEELQWLEGP